MEEERDAIGDAQREGEGEVEQRGLRATRDEQWRESGAHPLR